MKLDRKLFELTGEVREPKSGEYFLGLHGSISQAHFDFQESQYEILRLKKPIPVKEPLAEPSREPSSCKLYQRLIESKRANIVGQRRRSQLRVLEVLNKKAPEGA